VLPLVPVKPLPGSGQHYGGLVFHLGEEVHVKVDASFVFGKDTSEVVKAEHVAIFKGSVRRALLLHRIIGQVHVVVL